jgi:hypothetical protein
MSGRFSDFTAAAPNRKWVTDFTCTRTWSGFVYVAFIVDCFSRAIVGWHAATVNASRCGSGTCKASGSHLRGGTCYVHFGSHCGSGSATARVSRPQWFH